MGTRTNCETNPGPRRDCCGDGTDDVILDALGFDFGCQSIGIVSDPHTVVVTNIGLLTAHNLGTTITGPFQVVSTTCTDLAATEDCDVVITFMPTEAGVSEGVLTIYSDEVSVSVNLSGLSCGSIESCSISVCPNLDFGCVDVDTVSDPQTTLIINSTSEDIQIISIEIEGDPNFGVSGSETVPFSVPSGEVSPIEVTFFPTGPGAYVAKLKITSTAPSSPDYIRLTGMVCVAAPSLVLSLSLAPNTSGCGCSCSGGLIYVMNNGNTTESITNYFIHTTLRTWHDIDLIPSPIVLAPGEYTWQPYSFCPTEPGVGAADIRVHTTLGVLVSDSFSNTAVCEIPTIVPVVDSINFGSHKKSESVIVNVRFKVVTVGVYIPCSAAVVSFSTPDPWIDVPPNTGGLDLCSGGILTIPVGFPVALDPGSYSSSISIDWSSCGGGSGTASVSVTGTILPE